MVQTVRDHSIFFAQQGFENRAVRVKAGGEQKRVIRA
jgi:hypothetical protein